MSKKPDSSDRKQKEDSLVRPTSSLNRVKAKCEQSPNRLPSLRGPRDLTLGGIKKKTFAPNIPVRKDRNKTEVKEEAKSSAKPNRTKRDRSRDGRLRGRGRGRGGLFHRAETIQSHGIFEVGPGGESNNRGKDTHFSQSESSKQIQKPTIKNERVDLASEQQESEDVMRKLDEGNISLIADLQNDENLKPATLPLLPTPASTNRVEKKDGVIDPAKGNDPSMTSHVFGRQAEGKMILLQIPDTLPGIPPSEPDSPTIKQEAGTSSTKAAHNPQSSQATRCSLDQLSEGKIGKLQILKSGRCRLVLGDVKFNLRMGTPSSFAEEFASIRLPPEGSPESAKGHLTMLGNIDHKVICTPDMESLIKTT